MRKRIIIAHGVVVMVSFASPALAFDDISHEEDSCCFYSVSWEERLEIVLQEGSLEDYSDSDLTGGGELDGCWGDCYVANPGGREYLRCDYTGTDLVQNNVVVGRDANEDDRLTMCYSVDGGYHWNLAGFVDRHDHDRIQIFGSAAKDNMKIQNEDCYYNPICDFQDWWNDSEIQYLYMYGMGNADAIYGSRNSDTYLNAEYVEGLDGNDTISLTTFVSQPGDHPTAFGGNGNDTIYGTSVWDWICGGENDDTILGYGGDDELDGAGGADRIYGGDGNDYIWGGSGSDYVYGGYECDHIDGGIGYTDRCYTENEGGYCSNCSFPPSNCAGWCWMEL